MARPKKEPEERRSEKAGRTRSGGAKTVSVASVRCDLTAAEKAYLRQQAHAAGLSEAEFTRRAILGQAVSPRGSARADPALLAAINRIGVNVNQLAKATHRGEDFAADWRAIADEVRSLVERLAEDF